MLLFHSANGRSYPSIPFPEIVSDSLSPVRHLGIALIRPFLLVQCYFFYKLLYFRCDGGNGFTSVQTKNISFPNGSMPYTLGLATICWATWKTRNKKEN